MNPPSFQFYPADWLSDARVQVLNLEEEGAYIRLLCYCWREGSIPKDSSAIAQLCKNCSTAIADRVAALFILDPKDGSRLIHKRLSVEREKQVAYHKERSESGLRGVTKRWAKERQRHSSATDQLIAKHSSSSSSSSSDLRERESPLPEVPPITRKDFDRLAEMRGISKECADWYWNDCEKCNWMDTWNRPITNPESGLLNVWKTWRANATANKKGNGQLFPRDLKLMIDAKQNQIDQHPANPKALAFNGNPTDLERASLKTLRKELSDLNNRLATYGTTPT